MRDTSRPASHGEQPEEREEEVEAQGEPASSVAAAMALVDPAAYQEVEVHLKRQRDEVLDLGEAREVLGAGLAGSDKPRSYECIILNLSMIP